MKEFKADMAGIVVKIIVKPGDTIGQGTEVIILESMKMQIPMVCNVSGKVNRVHVKIDDFVNEGDLVLTLE